MDDYIKAPWEVVEIKEGHFNIYPANRHSTTCPIAVVDRSRDGHGPTRTQTAPANAHLIAQAPAMLEALKNYVKSYECHDDLHNDQRFWLKFKEIIARAEGKQ